MPWLAAAAVAAPIVGGLVGNYMAKGDKESQKKAMKQAMAELEKAGTPPDLSKALILQEFQKAGIYTPDLEEEINVAESEMGNLILSPDSKTAQMKALGLLGNLGKVGMGAEDRAALNQVRQATQRDAEAKRQQILQQMQAQGMGGSGASLMAQLGAGQQAAELASQQSDSLMANASSARRNAIEQYGRMAGEMRNTDYNQASEIARAKDERNKFLAQNSIERQRQNVGALNSAQQSNLQEQQRIADANNAMKNAETQRQSQAQRDYFQDKLGLASAKANALTGQANYYGQQAQNTAASYGAMGSAVGSGVAAYGQNQQNQANSDRTYELDKIRAAKGKA
jgi:hypothetical protein